MLCIKILQFMFMRHDLIILIFRYITYDPNYNYDDDDDLEDSMEEELDADDQDDEEDYSDDEDMSWKVVNKL